MVNSETSRVPNPALLYQPSGATGTFNTLSVPQASDPSMELLSSIPGATGTFNTGYSLSMPQETEPPPHLTITPNKLSVKEGDQGPVVLTCLYSNGRYPPTGCVTWNGPSGTLENHHRIQSINHFLYIYDVKRSDHGIYWCKNTTTGTDSTVAYLEVRRPPAIQGLIPVQSICLHQTALIYCKRDHGVPASNEIWRKDGVDVAFDYPRITPMEDGLEVYNVQKSDEGLYECFMQNEEGNVSYSIMVLVDDGSSQRRVPESSESAGSQIRDYLTTPTYLTFPAYSTTPAYLTTPTYSTTPTSAPICFSFNNYREDDLWFGTEIRTPETMPSEATGTGEFSELVVPGPMQRLGLPSENNSTISPTHNSQNRVGEESYPVSESVSGSQDNSLMVFGSMNTHVWM